MTHFTSWYPVHVHAVAAEQRAAIRSSQPTYSRNNLNRWGLEVYEPLRDTHKKAKLVQSVAKSIHENIPESYRTIACTDRIIPYELGSLPNYPAASNLLYFVQDTREAMQANTEALKTGDTEEINDSSIRLAATASNLFGSIGALYEWIKMLPDVSTHLPTTLTHCIKWLCIPVAIASCIVEGIGDVVGLYRQKRFDEKFDFELMSEFKALLEHPEALDSHEKVAKLIERFSEEDAVNRLKELQDALNQHPLFKRHIMETNAPKIEAIAKEVLQKNLNRMESEYLSLSSEDVANITATAKAKNQNVEEAKKIALEKKKKKFARRVMPWMVKEAEGTVPNLLAGLKNKDEQMQKKCLRTGLSLMNDLNIQSQKKKLIHWLGMIALAIAALGFLAMLMTCPHVVVIALTIAATAIAVIRYGIYKGLMNKRGWDSSLNNVVYETWELIKLKWNEFWNFEKATKATQEISLILHPSLARA